MKRDIRLFLDFLTKLTNFDLTDQTLVIRFA